MENKIKYGNKVVPNLPHLGELCSLCDPPRAQLLSHQLWIQNNATIDPDLQGNYQYQHHYKDYQDQAKILGHVHIICEKLKCQDLQ